MGMFRDFIEREEFVQFVEDAMNAPAQTPVKQWSASKAEIMDMWKKLSPTTPIYLTPMYKRSDGSTKSYGEDGVRITGSWHFIASVLGRLKELIGYENQQTKLRLIFRGVDQNKGRPDRNSYVFYLNSEERGKGRPNKK